MDCVFCKIIAGEIPSYTIYEDDVTFIISCPIDETDRITNDFINMRNARAEIKKIDKKLNLTFVTIFFTCLRCLTL